MIKEVIKCRICGKENLKTVLDFGEIFLSSFVKTQEDAIKAPLALVKCGDCGLVQLKHTVELDEMYRQYWYKSSLNKSMLKDLKDVIENVEKIVTLADSDIVVDIGCNDGSMFDFYTNRNIKMVGFDPALNLEESAKKHCTWFVNDYFSAKDFPYADDKAKVVTTIAMFYDLPDPNNFVDGVKSILSEDGIWVMQFTDLLSMLVLNAFDNVCHEHLEYYCLGDITKLMREHGLDVFRVEHNDVNGGSARIYISYKGKYPVQDSVLEYINMESEYFNSFEDMFKSFEVRVQQKKNTLLGVLNGLKEQGFKIGGIGASTKGNTLLQIFGITKDLISFITEINEDKFGLRTPGSDIEIIPEKLDEKQADVLVLLPWHFAANILPKYMTHFNNKGIIITPLPAFVIYGADENGKLVGVSNEKLVKKS
jgi:hypothetical protein